MIVAGNFNFIIYAGNNLALNFTWKDANGNPVNLTSYSATLECRQNLTDNSPFLSLSSGSGGITLGGASGTISINASTSDTSLLNAGNGVYDLQITDGSGVVSTLLQGYVTVQEMVTR